MREKILSSLKEIKSLPEFPDVLRKLQKVMNNPESSVTDIVKIIQLDPILAGKVMSISNSIYYTRGAGSSKTLNMAINKIGKEELKKIIYPLEFSKLFTDSNLINYKDFWRHSIGVAVYSQKLSEHLGCSQDESKNAYFSGLIHDIGIMVFAYLIPNKYFRLLRNINEIVKSLQDQEIEEFGIDHAELGAEFVRQHWRLDEEIIESIRSHHFPFSQNKEISKSIKVINVADGIITSYGIYNGIEHYGETFYEGAWHSLGLKLEDAQFLLNEVLKSLEEGDQLLAF